VSKFIVAPDLAVAYVCQEFSCMAPFTTVEELRMILDAVP
jgi:uncharacterized protein YyaL (SSP411 family)